MSWNVWADCKTKRGTGARIYWGRPEEEHALIMEMHSTAFYAGITVLMDVKCAWETWE